MVQPQGGCQWPSRHNSLDSISHLQPWTTLRRVSVIWRSRATQMARFLLVHSDQDVPKRHTHDSSLLVLPILGQYYYDDYDQQVYSAVCIWGCYCRWASGVYIQLFGAPSGTA